MDISALRNRAEDWFQTMLSRAGVGAGVREQSLAIMAAGAALVWVLLSVYLIVGVRAAHRHHRDLLAEMAQLNALVGDTSWQGRLQQSEALRFQLNDRLWPAPTAGVAQASFERWIRDHIAKQGLDAPQVQISLSPAAIQGASGSPRTLPGVQRMTAKVTTSFTPSAIAALTADMAHNDKVALIDQLIVRTQRNTRTEMNISTFVHLE